MSNFFETMNYTEEALRKVDALICDFFLKVSGEEADATVYPRWKHRKISWARFDSTYEDYEVTVEGICNVSVKHRMTSAPYRELKVQFRLQIIRARGILYTCGMAAGVLSLLLPERKKKYVVKYKAQGSRILPRSFYP